MLKLAAISLETCNFTKNELLHTYFSRILARFKFKLKNSKNTYFSKHLSVAASVSTYYNSHTCISNLFILTVDSYPFLPYLNSFLLTLVTD